MCTINNMGQYGLSGLLSPPCVARSSSEDAARSLTDLGTIFVATMVDAKDFIEQLEATFCNDLWPAFCAEMAKSRNREIEFDKYVDESTKQRERELLELEACQKRAAERVRTLVEYDVLLDELEQEKARCTALREEAQRSQNLAGEVERLQEAAKLSETKIKFLQVENQRLKEKRAIYEKSQVLQTRRKNVGNSPSSSMAGQGGEPVPNVSCEDPHASNKDCVQPLCDLQRQPMLECNGQVDEGLDSPSSDRETKKQPRGRPTPVHMKADNIVDASGVATPFERQPEKAKSPGCLPEESETTDALEIECFQRPKGDSDADPIPGRRVVDSDETVMEAVQQDSFVPDVAQDLPVICISTENQAAPCDEPFQVAPEMVVTNKAIRSGAAARADEDERNAKIGASLASNPRRPPCFRPTFVSLKLGNRSKDHPWRQTRSRAEPCEGDPHDSFLDTPREKAFAKLKGTSLDQARMVDTHAVQQEVPVKNDYRVGKGLVTDVVLKSTTARQDHSSASSRLVTSGTITGGHDRKQKNALNSKRPGYKFNEPVRKKRDREALQSTDCKQCKKFYDAVEAGDATEMTASRCEHQNAVSKHRYLNVPPITPEGFWDIGFNTIPTQDKTF